MISDDLRSAYRFHKAEGGYVVGRRAAGALAAARAELALREAIDAGRARVRWEDEDISIDDARGDIPYAEFAHAVETYGHYWSALDVRAAVCGCCGRGGGWETAASLGSVVGDENYRRTVEADLALEAGFGEDRQ